MSYGDEPHPQQHLAGRDDRRDPKEEVLFLRIVFPIPRRERFSWNQDEVVCRKQFPFMAPSLLSGDVGYETR